MSVPWPWVDVDLIGTVGADDEEDLLAVDGLHARAGDEDGLDGGVGQRVVVGEGDRDGEDAAAGVGVAAREGPRTAPLRHRAGRDRPVAPVDRDGVRVQRAHVGERAGNGDGLPLLGLVTLRRTVVVRGDDRGDVVDRDLRAAGVRPCVVVGDRQVDGVVVRDRGGRVVVEVLVGEDEVRRAGREDEHLRRCSARAGRPS